jgi:hypothetical protein
MTSGVVEISARAAADWVVPSAGFLPSRGRRPITGAPAFFPEAKP